MIDWAILALSFAGFALFLFANPRHQQDWLRRKFAQTTSRAARAGGFLSLTLEFAFAGLGFGWAYGAVVWLGWLTIAAILVVAVHTNRDRILTRIRQ